jgi:hypothetical protein
VTSGLDQEIFVSNPDDDIPKSEFEELISDLETVTEKSPVFSVAAVHILKNELALLDEPAARRNILFDQEFVLPGTFLQRIRGWFPSLPGAWQNLTAWLAGRDAQLFRDRCDRAFWDDMVPVIEVKFDNVAEPIMNTVNEAILNYAEYSFKRWALWRKVGVHLFRTEEDLAYAIIRPRGLRVGVFDPLELKEKGPETVLDQKRGWGHTILMRHALFVSFDQAARMRGMMIIVGPES